MSEIPHTLSFYGTDGCGKTSIAHAMLAQSYHSYTNIGGSSYKTWLSDEVARLTLGPNHRLNKHSSDSVELFEDIAVACYGLARHLNLRGQSVLIDSDPYTKRVIWSAVEHEGLDTVYLERFESKMTEHLGDDFAPSHIAAINMNSSGSEQSLLDRLQSRAGNSVHDPTKIDEMTTLNEHVSNIWREIELAKRGLSAITGFNARFSHTHILHVENHDCAPEDIQENAQSVANTIGHNITHTMELE